MTERKIIAFDMDGTIADLYAVEGWLKMLRAEDARPYMMAQPMWDMEELANVLNELKMVGWEVRVITWLSKDSSQCYKDQVRQAKREWLEEIGFPFDYFHGVQYGATKADSIRKVADYAILIDDNDKVREGWHLGATINPVEENIVEVLKSLLI